MIRILALLCAFATAAVAATGDILSVTVRPDGWTADVAIQGLNTGGTYSSGLGALNVITGNEKMTLTVVSHGYNGTTLTTKTRTIYGVKPMRKVWPNDAQNEETNVSGVTTVRMILNDLIYDEDDAGAGNSGTAITASFRSGLYTFSGTPTNATGSPITVTNNSTVAFWDGIGNWAWPGYQKMDSTTKLRAVVFHRHGEQYRPVNCVRFSVTDGTTTNYETVTAPTYNPSFGDFLPVVEYVTTTDLTAGLTQGAELTCNFVAYPWVGDNPLDTSTGAAAPSPLVGPIKGVCDRTGAYGVTYAVVDAVSGSDPASVTDDTGKWLGNGSDPGAGSGVTAYATLARAARAIANYNTTNRGRGDVGGGLVLAKPGSYSTFGSSPGGYGTVPKTWITFKPFPGVAQTDVILAEKVGNSDISDRVKLEGLTLQNAGGNAFSGCLAMWLHDCRIDSSAAGVWNNSGQYVWVTHSDIPQLGQGLRGYSTTNMGFPLVRGCNLNGFNKTIVPYTFLGNSNTVPAGSFSVRDTVSGSLAPRPIAIIAFNKFLGLNGTGSYKFQIGTDSANLTGAAVVQNVIENYTDGSSGLASIGSSHYDHHNLIFWHNTLVGQRTFIAYNDDGTVPYYRFGWSMINNYMDRFGNKGDTFSPQDSNRIGGWQVKFGVGRSGEYYSENMISVPGNFTPEWDGLSSYDPDDVTVGTAEEAMFVDRRSATPTLPGAGTATAGVGGGDYSLQEGSPLIGRPIVNVVQYDMAGVERTNTNRASGAYAGPGDPPANDFPVVTITSPANGASQDSPVLFIGTATDTEDGTISANIVWTSSLDGALGTGASINPSLSVGTHTITATITDSATQVDTDSITVTVTAPPPGGTIEATRVNAGTATIR